MKERLSLRGSCTPKRRLQRLGVFKSLLLAALTLFIRLNSVLVIWLFLDVGEKFFRDWYLPYSSGAMRIAGAEIFLFLVRNVGTTYGNITVLGGSGES
jgi:hypothetical protein